MTVIGFDTETWPITPGCMAPPMVCYQWQRQGSAPDMLHRQRAKSFIKAALEGCEVMVGHNVAYDMAVICANFPDLMPLVFAKYNRDQVTDTKAREQLIMIGRGQFRSWQDAEGVGHPVNYALADCVARHFGRQLKKEGFRMFYRAFEETPNLGDWARVAAEFQARCRAGDLPDWVRESPDALEALPGLLEAHPSEAMSYALEDPKGTLELYEDQAAVAQRLGIPLDDEFRKARAAFALNLASCWGIYTDPDAVEALAQKLEARFAELTRDLQDEGIIREDGSADTKAAMAAMVEACQEEGLPVFMTAGGKKPKKDGTVSPPQVSLSAEACDRFDAGSVIGMYSEFCTTRKTLSNDIKMLRKGCEIPIQPRYDFADTGRTRCAKPNIQAINRGEGIRECFRPREGFVFIQADFEGLELHTLAQWCLTVLGKSELAKKLNAKIDFHTDMAATLLGISYEEALARKKAGDKQVKDFRQIAKPINFGYPGGMGAKKMRRYAKAQYGVEMTLEDATTRREVWLRKLPEMVDFFRHAAQATANPDQVATEAHIFTNRLRGKVRYSALCNGRFQGLGADAALQALWDVTEACYVKLESPLYGCRPVAFVHDEVIAECPDDPARIDAAARELGRVMCAGANRYLKDVPVRTEPQAMVMWSKSAVPVYVDGRIVPWAPPAPPSPEAKAA